MPAIDLRELSAAIIPVLFAITVHEVAHGWIARKLGDPTAYMLGRLTLNPIKHIDPVGTVIVPLALHLLQAGFLFGWAKPVPVAVKNLRNPRRDMAFVALGGPVSNLVMATIWASIAIPFMSQTGPRSDVTDFILTMVDYGVRINVTLAVLNLLPLPPLDGGRVLAAVVPRQAANLLDRVEPFGFIILIVLLVTGTLSPIIEPFAIYLLNFFADLMRILR